jgi:DHA2 family multidrug resistance protein-like MFS transporter
MTHVASSESLRATKREWIGLAVIALPCLIYSMDLTVLNLAVPQLSADLRPTSAQLLWIVDIYGFLVAGSLMTMGTLGDRIGRRRLLLIGAAAFGAASLVAAFSTSAEMLIFARALLGIAGATLAPSTLSLIRNMFLDSHERTFAIGVWIACFSAGGAIGPLLGGVLLEHFWWGSVFLLNVPFMLLLLAVGPILLPEFRDPNAGRIDLLSAALSLVAVLSVIYGMKRIAEGDPDWIAASIILLGLVVGAVFVRRQRRLADPLIDVTLFRDPIIGGALAINILGLFIAFGSFLFVAQYLQLVLGMTPLEAGLWTAPTGIAFAAGSVLTPLIVRRVKPVHVMTGGFLLVALGFALMTQIGTPGGFWMLMVGLIVFCIGLSPIGTLTTDIVVGMAPPERAGAAAGISETSFEFGGALGIAVLGSIVIAVYRGAMADGLPYGVPDGLAEAARDTLGGALAAAHQTSDALGAQVLGVARQAFTDALRLTSALCGVLAVGGAALCYFVLRRVDMHGQPGSGGSELGGEVSVACEAR